MKEKRFELYKRAKSRGLTPEQEGRMQAELHDDGDHAVSPISEVDRKPTAEDFPPVYETVYPYSDLFHLQAMTALQSTYSITLRSIDELLERDKQRAKDGFPRKINVGRLIKPGKGGKDKVVIVPTTVEEKFIHDPSFKESGEDSPTGGTGDGEEGDVIGEQPVRDPEASGAGPGEGEGGAHELESSAYDLGQQF